jgi:hypothetical protein
LGVLAPRLRPNVLDSAGRRRELTRRDDAERFAAWSLAPFDAPWGE